MNLFGKNPVIERLRSNPQSIRKIYIEEGLQDVSSIRQKAKACGIPLYPVSASKLLKMGRAKNTQGVLADVEDFAYVSYEELLERALEKKRCPVFLDGLTDPQNLGAVIRSLACLGKFSLILPTHDSVGMTETVLRVACGGENYVPVAKVANLAQALAAAKAAGFWIGGAVVGEGQSVFEADLPHPLALVAGSEQKGIRPVIRRLVDVELTIPMAVETMSFNVAHALTILGYEITKQKKNYQSQRQHQQSSRP